MAGCTVCKQAAFDCVCELDHEEAQCSGDPANCNMPEFECACAYQPREEVKADMHDDDRRSTIDELDQGLEALTFLVGFSEFKADALTGRETLNRLRNRLVS